MLDNPFVLLAVLASYQFCSYHLQLKDFCLHVHIFWKTKDGLPPPEVSQTYNISDCTYIKGNVAKALLYNLHMTLFFVNECFTELTVI
jgi:hypothetical protein